MALDKLSIATRGYKTADGFNKRAIAVDGYIPFTVEILPPGPEGPRFRITPRQAGEPVWDPYYKSGLEEVILDPHFEEDELLIIITMFLKYESQGLFN